MSHWESQIRTNLEDPAYATVLEHAIASSPGLLGAGLVNVRYAEGALKLQSGRAVSESDLEQLVALTRALFPLPGVTALSQAQADAVARLHPVEAAYFSTRTERLFVAKISNERSLALSVAASLRLGAAAVLVAEAVKALRAHTGSGLDGALDGLSDVLAAGVLDTRSGTFEAVPGDGAPSSEFAFDDEMAATLAQLFGDGTVTRPLTFTSRAGEPLEIVHLQISGAAQIQNWWTLPFDPEHVMYVAAEREVLPGLVWTVAKRAADDTVRVWADGLLAWGIDAMIEPFPKTQREFLEIVEELRRLDENDLIERLRIGGFTNYSMGEGDNIQRCQECIYYHPHRKWCDLPELPIPVEPHWWCRLWKL